MHWAVILAGGSGTRFWPLSTSTRPKHLLPLVGGVPTALGALHALEPVVPRERILLVTGRELAPRLAELLGLPGTAMLVEPRPASTGPALVWATMEALRRDPQAAVLSMHADWQLADPAAFAAAAGAALEAATRHDLLVTTGVDPVRPDPSLGYIVPGAPLDGRVLRVSRFVEKPDEARARELISGGALWNTGLFAWTGSRLVAEVKVHASEITAALPRLEAGDVASFFREVTPVSIDVAVLERSDRVATLRGEFPWDDIGTWSALARVRPADARGNVLEGPLFAVGSRGCVGWSDSLPVVLSGVRDLVVVCANGRVLVMPREESVKLKDTLEALPPEVRDLP